ncbi:MAG: HEPN domain-containing protein [Cytophagales bacterium]|nr:HEPN domain-containing protein [Cytophagales bacterium]
MDQDKIKNVEHAIASWVESSNEDFDAMVDMYNSGRYSWSMFIGHLCVEKLLKAYYIKIMHEHCINTHNLLRICELAGLSLTQVQKQDFATITTFNIRARYDDYKQDFHKKCTKEFTDEWIEKIKSHRQWIKELLK